ncbi:MAG TPA: DUF1361 domain-containing protein [Thermoanaerobaculia bacterium]|jgi:uncharacterized membrane protein|nr:DUF1361 domain-containing protein [Thermoanaerobaculia bacterium]
MVKRIAVFAVLLVWCWALLVLRMWHSDSLSYLFLVWNLVLAAIPFAAALLFEWLDHKHSVRPLQWTSFVVWLLFLPNAPYIITDFIHLKQRGNIPLWYDVLLLLSCAGAGLLLGYASVMIVQHIFTRHYGVIAGWGIALGALLLSAFGIYLGRFLRWNSWEAFTDPLPLFRDIASQIMNPMSHPKTFAVTGLFGVALCLGYIALDVLAESLPED